MKNLLLLSLILIAGCQKERKPCKYNGVEVSCSALENQLYQAQTQMQLMQEQIKAAQQQRPEKPKEPTEKPTSKKVEITAELTAMISMDKNGNLEILENRETKEEKENFSCTVSFDNGEKFKLKRINDTLQVTSANKHQSIYKAAAANNLGFLGTWVRVKKLKGGGQIGIQLHFPSANQVKVTQKCIFQKSL